MTHQTPLLLASKQIPSASTKLDMLTMVKMVPQGYGCNKNLHLCVPSNAKNTQVGWQISPEGTASQTCIQWLLQHIIVQVIIMN